VGIQLKLSYYPSKITFFCLKTVTVFFLFLPFQFWLCRIAEQTYNSDRTDSMLYGLRKREKANFCYLKNVIIKSRFPQQAHYVPQASALNPAKHALVEFILPQLKNSEYGNM
jgi:hypothetical protein